jgi:hypothetical protein
MSVDANFVCCIRDTVRKNFFNQAGKNFRFVFCGFKFVVLYESVKLF